MEEHLNLEKEENLKLIEEMKELKDSAFENAN